MDDDQKQQQQEEHALVDCTTTTGPITLHLHRAWSPYGYDRATLSSDLVAAVIVTLMLIPQSLAYASLAGLPPQVGLYASMAPLLFNAAFGIRRVLAVGPVAVV